MTDAELIEQINASVQSLNALLREAMQAGLEYDAEILDIRTFSDPVDSKLLTIQKFRKVLQPG